MKSNRRGSGELHDWAEKGRNKPVKERSLQSGEPLLKVESATKPVRERGLSIDFYSVGEIAGGEME